MSVQSGQCSCRIAVEGRLGLTYNEQAFRHFLAIERRRAEQSRRSFVLLLVKLRPQHGKWIPPAMGSRIVSGLLQSVREVDFVGWLREHRVAAAVLTQGADPPTRDVLCGIGRRIAESLRQSVPPDDAGRLHIRVLQLKPRRS